MDVAAFYYLEGGLLFGFLVAAGLTVVSLNKPNYRVARRCAWASAILFGSIAVVWGLTTMESAWIRIPAVGIAGMIAAVCLTEALRFVKDREFPGVKAAEVTAPAQEVSSHLAFIRVGPGGSAGRITAIDTVVFGTPQILDIEGHIDSAEFNNNRLYATYPPIKAERTVRLGDLSDLELKSRLRETVGELQALQREENNKDDDIFRFDQSAESPKEKMAKSQAIRNELIDRYRTSLSAAVLLFQSEILWRLSSARITVPMPTGEAWKGYIHMLSGKMGGATPFLAVADYLEYLAGKLPDDQRR